MWLPTCRVKISEYTGWPIIHTRNSWNIFKEDTKIRCWTPPPILPTSITLKIIKRDGNSYFFVVKDFLFHYNTPEIEYDKKEIVPSMILNCFMSAIWFLSLFLLYVVPWSNTRCCACGRLKRDKHTRKTV